MSAGSESFSAMEAIEEGRWDAYLHRLHGAIHQRQKTSEYKATLIAGEPSVPQGWVPDPTRGDWRFEG